MKRILPIAAACVFVALAGCDENGESDPASERASVRPAAASQPASRPSPQPTSQPDPSGQYAGSASCAECHEEAYAEWKTSHHALAQRPLSADLDDEAFVPRRTIGHGSQTSFAELQGGRCTIVTTGRDGRQNAYDPTGAIGVDPLWQYLIPQPGGRLQVTELAYDPAKKEWFDVYGNEDRQHWEWGHWSGRGMTWNDMCAACHTTSFRKNYDPDTDTYASTYLELGIGCEQCHGPMKDHVDWQDQHPDQQGDPTIRVWDRDEYLSVCGSCHARRRELGSDFHPGDGFLDHYDPFVPDTSDVFYPDGQVREEDFEYTAFTLSYMYAWGVRCMDCHYWHSGKVASTENTLCLRCHERGIGTKRPIDAVQHSQHPPDKAGFKCADCHMPQTVYMARHWRHDHGMTIPDPLLTKEHGIANACTRCHVEEGLDWSIEYVEKWYGELMNRPTRARARLLARVKAGDLGAVPAILALLKEEKKPNWRAVYAQFLAPVLAGEVDTDQSTASAVTAKMVELLEDDSPLVQAAAIEALEPLGQVAAALLAPKLDSPHRLVRVKAAWVLRRHLEEGSKAKRDLLAYLGGKLDQPVGAFQWANYLADLRQMGESLSWFEKAIAWEPAAAVYRLRHAAILKTLGRHEDAAAQLAEAARIEPTNGFYPYLLAELYSAMGKTEAARDALKLAVARDDKQARYWGDLAVAEAQLGQFPAALEAIAKAEQLQPGEAHYPYVRATIYYRLGQHDEARKALERALELDPTHAGALKLMQGL